MPSTEYPLIVEATVVEDFDIGPGESPSLLTPTPAPMPGSSPPLAPPTYSSDDPGKSHVLTFVGNGNVFGDHNRLREEIGNLWKIHSPMAPLKLLRPNNLPITRTENLNGIEVYRADSSLSPYIDKVEINPCTVKTIDSSLAVPNYLIPIRLYSEQEVPGGDLFWNILFRGGEFGEKYYPGLIPTDELYYNTMFRYRIPYSVLETKHAGVKKGAVNPQVTDYTYGAFLRDYESTVDKMPSELLIPSYYMFKNLKQASQHYRTYATLLNTMPIGRVKDAVLDSKQSAFEYLDRRFAHVDFPEILQNQVINSQENIIFDDIYYKRSKIEKAGKLLFPYYTSIKMPKHEGSFQMRDSIARHDFSAKFVEILKDVYDENFPHVIPQNYQYTVQRNSITASHTGRRGRFKGPIEYSDVSKGSYKTLDFLEFLTSIYNNYSASLNDNYSFIGDRNAARESTFDSTGFDRYYNNQNVIAVIDDAVAHTRQILNRNENKYMNLKNIINLPENKVETLAYRIKKMEGEIDSDSAVSEKGIQNFWFFNSKDMKENLELKDTQVKYGKKYTYQCYAYALVSTYRYRYTDLRLTKQIARIDTDGDGMVDLYCMQFYEPRTNNFATQLFYDNIWRGSSMVETPETIPTLPPAVVEAIPTAPITSTPPTAVPPAGGSIPGPGGGGYPVSPYDPGGGPGITADVVYGPAFGLGGAVGAPVPTSGGPPAGWAWGVPGAPGPAYGVKVIAAAEPTPMPFATRKSGRLYQNPIGIGAGFNRYGLGGGGVDTSNAEQMSHSPDYFAHYETNGGFMVRYHRTLEKCWLPYADDMVGGDGPSGEWVDCCEDLAYDYQPTWCNEEGVSPEDLGLSYGHGPAWGGQMGGHERDGWHTGIGGGIPDHVVTPQSDSDSLGAWMSAHPAKVVDVGKSLMDTLSDNADGDGDGDSDDDADGGEDEEESSDGSSGHADGDDEGTPEDSGSGDDYDPSEDSGGDSEGDGYYDEPTDEEGDHYTDASWENGEWVLRPQKNWVPPKWDNYSIHGASWIGSGQWGGPEEAPAPGGFQHGQTIKWASSKPGQAGSDALSALGDLGKGAGESTIEIHPENIFKKGPIVEFDPSAVVRHLTDDPYNLNPDGGTFAFRAHPIFDDQGRLVGGGIGLGGSFKPHAPGLAGDVIGGGTTCVLAGTMIETERGRVPVEQITTNDKAYSYNFEKEEYGYYNIVDVMPPSERSRWAMVRTTSGKSIKCTEEHPLYTLNSEDNKLPVNEASIGDTVHVLVAGKLVKDSIESIQYFEENTTVYNLEVEEVHSYISDEVLSHNKVIGTGGRSSGPGLPTGGPGGMPGTGGPGTTQQMSHGTYGGRGRAVGIRGGYDSGGPAISPAMRNAIMRDSMLNLMLAAPVHAMPGSAMSGYGPPVPAILDDAGMYEMEAEPGSPPPGVFEEVPWMGTPGFSPTVPPLPELLPTCRESILSTRNPFATLQQDLSEHPHIADVYMHVEPCLKLVEIPLFSKTQMVIDHPGNGTSVYPFQYLDDSQRLGYEISYESHVSKTFPTTITPADKILEANYLHANNLLPVELITKESVSRARYVEIFRTDRRPAKFEDFEGNFVKILDLRVEETDYVYADTIHEEKVNTNKKYYYLFRFLNEHFVISHPSEILECELVSDGGYKYATYGVLYEQELKTAPPSETTIQMKKLLQIQPNMSQLVLSTSDVNFNKTAKEQLNKVNVGVAKDLIWGSTFKLRLISKKTGRKLDINVNFKIEETPESAPPSLPPGWETETDPVAPDSADDGSGPSIELLPPDILTMPEDWLTDWGTSVIPTTPGTTLAPITTMDWPPDYLGPSVGGAPSLWDPTDSGLPWWAEHLEDLGESAGPDLWEAPSTDEDDAIDAGTPIELEWLDSTWPTLTITPGE